MITLSTELGRIRGLSPRYVLSLKKLKLETVRDLLWHFPTRYDDFSRIVPIAELEPHDSATIEGTVQAVELKKTWKQRIPVVEALIRDQTGSIRAVWFNQPYIARILHTGERVNFAGKVSGNRGELYLSNPSYEPMRGHAPTKHTSGLIPVYGETRGITSRGIRYLVEPLLRVLPELPDALPVNVRRLGNFPEIREALRAIHFPHTLEEASRAKQRFAFEDLFYINLYHLSLRARLKKEAAPVITLSLEEKNGLFSLLPFTLTESQKESFEEILADLGRGTPMNRLLQGDVGSGKTAVAALAAFALHKKKLSSLFMAPTEVLARQHYETLERLSPSTHANIGLLLGKEARLKHADGLESKISKKKLMEEALNGSVDILIGTHALLHEELRLPSLGLVVIDEQHRFGVSQRAKLRSQKDSSLLPHFLSMSATPIPRTLSLTFFGDLDLSIIKELPSGRKPIITKVVAPHNREKAYEFIRKEVTKGRQIFVICPRIISSEETTKKNTHWSDVKTVTDEHERLSKKVFPDLRVAMLHGKMKSKEKTVIMDAFKARQSDILVSTSVIEVGVDIPNASVMIIEGAELFGLAQLYQFRGRIGRGEHQSYCLLFTSAEGGDTSRLAALEKAKNGFELAELDLKLRGPGEFLGEKQTGLPDVAMQALHDIELVKIARTGALETLTKDPELVGHPLLKEHMVSLEKRIHLA